MDTLDQYLTGAFASDQRDIAQIERLVQEIADTLSSTFNVETAWPYRLQAGNPEVSKGVSQSTTAMVVLSLARLLGDFGRVPAKDGAPRFPSLALRGREAVESVTEGALRVLAASINKADVPQTTSGMYGQNDPVTLSFLAALTALPKVAGDTSWKNVTTYVQARAKSLCQNDPNNQASFYNGIDNDIVENAILPLRVVQSVKNLNEQSNHNLIDFREYFETRLHDQLSYSSIPDSRFDPAELTFCLEGLLICQENAVDPSIFTRVVEVLGKAQKESAFWRPTKPFLATVKGMSLFPVSVEVANSLLRSCELYDGGELHDTFGSACLSLFRRYWQWLRARTVRFRDANKDYVGWHSEHVNEIDAIHVWETSQVLEFLLGYRRLLQSHVARTTLIRSRFIYQKATAPDDADETWAKVVDGFEPVVSLGKGYEVYGRLGDDFVQDWKGGHPKNYSMLLYGPPGTGKTTVAENIADALSFPMLTITVSDFLAGGGAEIEARAKAIFDVLIAQPECVVLFDEIDNFLLDRDSERYARQDSIFQFMTSGMLTKLNDLRRAKRLIFVVATNYENRIDPAIKRTGRIDRKYLVLPPDGKARKRIIQSILRKRPNSKNLNPDNWSEDDADMLARASIFLGFKDIEGAIDEGLRESAPNVSQLATLLEQRARTTSLAAYREKFAPTAEETPPYEEFICLLGMALEYSGTPFSSADTRATAAAAAALSQGANAASITGDDMLANVRHAARLLNEDVAVRVAERLRQAL